MKHADENICTFSMFWSQLVHLWFASPLNNESFLCMFPGMVWAQQVNGELYAIAPDSSDASLVASPVFVSYSVNSHTVWGLTSEGEIYIRTGMGPHCPLGVDWTTLDLSQLGEWLVFIATGKGSRCPWGTDWKTLSLAQLGEWLMFVTSGKGSCCPLGIDWVTLDLAQCGGCQLDNPTCCSLRWVIEVQLVWDVGVN